MGSIQRSNPLLPHLLLLFFLHILSSCCSYGRVRAETEARALLEWKSSLNHPCTLTSWSRSLTNSSSPCKWFGIGCDHADSVVELKLSSSKLNGTLHHLDFSSFANLTTLNLSANFLYGSIPPEVSLLSKLASLDLSANNLSGRIPKEIGNSVNLVYLFLGGNSLSGPIPNEIGNLVNLVGLYLAENSLTGRIPLSIASLVQLRYVHLSTNHLSGPIPKQIGSLVNLISLYLAENSLTGKIPPSIGILYLAPDSMLSQHAEGEGDIIWFYITIVLGFVVGFWIFFGTLIFNKRLRMNFFNFIDDVQDWLHEKGRFW